jgi:uncharacterized protein (TIGR03435 family)
VLVLSHICYKNNMMQLLTYQRMLCAAVLAAAIIVSASAQSTTPAGNTPLRFEVASVKPNKSESILVLPAPVAPDRYRLTNVTLRTVIADAFSVPAYRLVNAPDWTGNERFDINAQMAANVKPAPGVQSEMLRTLLAERFRLVVHRETRDLPVSALVLARTDRKPGPNLELASPECAPGGSRRLGPGPDGRPQLPPPGVKPCGLALGPGTMQSGYLTMEGLTRTLSVLLQRNVLDRTGLTGAFQFELAFAPEPTAGAGNPPPAVDLKLPTLVTALQEQLGLKLEPGRAPIEVLVIDSVDRPTPD